MNQVQKWVRVLCLGPCICGRFEYEGRLGLGGDSGKAETPPRIPTGGTAGHSTLAAFPPRESRRIQVGLRAASTGLWVTGLALVWMHHRS